ncbi:HNH endonuclease [Coprobacillus sp. AM28-15LB]|nr:HNH endonuclease [Coprobacillus sp. AM28-15LB]
MSMRYTQEMRDYIIEIAPGRLNSEIADMFNKKFGTNLSAKTIKSYKDNHKIISGISKIDYSRIKHKKLLNDEQVEYLKKIYQGISNRECTRLMNEKFNTSFSCQQIKAQKRNLHLISGLTGRFEKGSRPANPIQKGEHLSVETEFQKGHTPKNWVPVGAERKRSDGYIYIKVSDKRGVKYSHLINWKPKHILLWEKEYGPIPEDKSLLFLDGNKENVTLDNLALITKAQRLIMCNKKLIYDDPKLTKEGILIAQTLDATYKKQNELKEKRSEIHGNKKSIKRNVSNAKNIE